MLLPRSLQLLLLACLANAAHTQKRSYDTHNYYALEHDPSSSTTLEEIAQELGLEILHQAGQLDNHWMVRAPIPEHDALLSRATTSITGVKSLTHQIPRQRTKRAPPPPLKEDMGVVDRLQIADPLFGEQWHLLNPEFPEHMMNVTGLWELGYTGEGVISSLVDDGLDYTSLDLKDNFDAANSYDYNDHEDLPTPKLSDDHHGTRCAGQVAAGKNAACGLGIAYDSRVAGVRILSGAITDVDEAAALNHGYQEVSVYSCSWGPPDNGKSMEGPSYLIKKAVLNGINKGRDGKGSIFVFASGNGASHGDQCNFDGYTNSIYSVTVGAVDHAGALPYYPEPCSANMVVTYSSGGGKSIVTTDKGENACSKSHGGTSAAAPNASGVFVLAVQARPDLTWRDLQYLCVNTAKQINADDGSWEMTAAGRPYSNSYGYGVLDGYNLVMAAKDWQLVKPQAWILTHSVQVNNGSMTEDGDFNGGELLSRQGVESALTITEEMMQNHNMEVLEHINIRVWIQHQRRGDVEVEVTSPNGIKSVLAQQRSADDAKGGFPGWVFMSVKHWGENPVGDWTIRVSDQGKNDSEGRFIGWNMILWGEALDAEITTLYQLPPDHDAFPPFDDPPEKEIPSTTKTHLKPTHFLSSDHGAEPTGVVDDTQTDATSTPTSTPTPDEGWFAGMGNLVSHPKWIFGAASAVVLFGIGAGVFFWRRRRQAQARYNALPGEDGRGAEVSMTGMGASATGGTRELYDAFGEVSDDEDDDEHAPLRRDSHSGRRSEEGNERYRDEPQPRRLSQE